MTNHIKVMGLGAADLEQLPLGVYRTLVKGEGVRYARTLDHPVIKALEDEGVTFESFDHVYEEQEQFGDVYETIVEQLIKEAEGRDIIYVVPGHPMLAEKTVQLLLIAEKNERVSVSIQGGQSYLDDLFTSLQIDPIEGFQFIDATGFSRSMVEHRQHTVFCQVYDEMIASEVKVSLLEDLPPEFPVYIVDAVGSKQERIEQVPLFELDHQVELSNLTSVYVPPVSEDQLAHQFFRVRDVIAALRAPDGCPWDRKQTHESLRPYLIEEAYELIQAIDDQDDEGIIEELGDVLLQVLLHSQIGEDEGFFTIDDVILSLTEKMIRRHPHVFSDRQADDVDQVMRNWDEIKKDEKGLERPSVLDGVVEALPGLMRAQELQKKAKKVGFDWDDPQPMWEKVKEEMDEFEESLRSEAFSDQELEYGDVLFAFVNLARYYKINPELAIQRTNDKFERRFKEMEAVITSEGQEMQDMTLEQLDYYWVQAKNREKGEK
ncbi:hypothetical protein N780_09725 [Pontibacillus chungwhensis BH030062]|uniref:MazG family protein n=1 Tax=Pontibacillus chungwhensis BH030062 TaxID=1385513 RepID=A0A0A2UTV2_9BACI|nr:nucleoside triphosphate pyrophosphohydrolase [Pontibacillus chungwhensis]KGP89906.1 hypothetical protein N780_09725 [Pontibacillus chungwhensis BH030062]